MLRLRLTLPLVLVALSFGIQNVHAATKLRAILTNAGELPTVVVPTMSGPGNIPRPASYGVAIFELNDLQTAMTMSATIHNIDFGGQTPTDTNDNLTAAHIHASDALNPVPPPGTRGVVWGFLGTPDNDIAPNDLVVTPFANKAGAFVTSKWDQGEGNGTNTLTNNIARILSERSYLNFHTMQFTGGEIRGTLTVIPEPTTALMLLSGLAMVALRRRVR